MLAVAGGAAGYHRYGAYSDDVKAAQSLSSQGQYAKAEAKFHQAIDEWPINSDAKSGLTSAESALYALTQQGKARLDTGTVRANMFKARSVARSQVAAQADATAAASKQAP